MACHLAIWDSAARKLAVVVALLASTVLGDFSMEAVSPAVRGTRGRNSPSWRQNASKKIDAAWQFPAAVIEYLYEGQTKILKS
jgi:hypothetical protein